MVASVFFFFSFSDLWTSSIVPSDVEETYLYTEENASSFFIPCCLLDVKETYSYTEKMLLPFSSHAIC